MSWIPKLALQKVCHFHSTTKFYTTVKSIFVFQEFKIGKTAAKNVSSYHQLCHFKYNLYDKCQAKVCVILFIPLFSVPRALDKREYLMIIFLISHRNHMLWPSSEPSHQDGSDEFHNIRFYAEFTKLILIITIYSLFLELCVSICMWPRTWINWLKIKQWHIIRAPDNVEFRDTSEKFFSEVDIGCDPLCNQILLMGHRLSFYREICKIIWSSEFMHLIERPVSMYDNLSSICQRSR